MSLHKCWGLLLPLICIILGMSDTYERLGVSVSRAAGIFEICLLGTISSFALAFWLVKGEEKYLDVAPCRVRILLYVKFIL